MSAPDDRGIAAGGAEGTVAGAKADTAPGATAGSAASAATGGPIDNRRGALWLVADMLLNVSALGLVKGLGAGYPASQVVFLRAAIGLVLIGPWAWRERHAFARVEHRSLHALRVLLSSVALTASFHAVARVPLALFTAIQFTRPLVLMALVAWFLSERIPRRRWLAAAGGLVGVLIATAPSGAARADGLAALGVAVLAGSAAIVVTRRLAGTPPVVLMTFYASGLALAAAPLAALSWQPIAPAHWTPLLGIGLLAQCAQFCFLRAHRFGEAGVLAPLGYLSLLLSGLVGYVGFGEVPTLATLAGAAVILVSAALVGLPGCRRR